jgi:hypothetical protein
MSVHEDSSFLNIEKKDTGQIPIFSFHIYFVKFVKEHIYRTPEREREREREMISLSIECTDM